MHAQLSNPTPFLQVSTWPMGQDPPACQSTDTEFDWFTFSERLTGQTALCLLIPAQSAAGPSHPEANWSVRQRTAAPAAAPKIKLLPSVCVAGGKVGVSRPPETAEVQPLQAGDSHLHLRKRWSPLLGADQWGKARNWMPLGPLVWWHSNGE